MQCADASPAIVEPTSGSAAYVCGRKLAVCILLASVDAPANANALSSTLIEINGCFRGRRRTLLVIAGDDSA
jgi:hypothetical protein